MPKQALIRYFILLLLLMEATTRPLSSLCDTEIPLSGEMTSCFQPLTRFDYAAAVDVQWSPNGDYLAISTAEALWVHPQSEDADVIKLPPTASATGFDPGAFRFDAQSPILAVVDPNSGDLHRWDLSVDPPQSTVITAQVISSDGFYAYEGFAAISPDLSLWAIAYRDGTIYLLDGVTGEERAKLTGHTRVGALVFTADGMRLISGGKGSVSSLGTPDTFVRLWDSATGALVAALDVGYPVSIPINPPQIITLSPDGKHAAFAIRPDAFPILSLIGLIDLNALSYTLLQLEDHHIISTAFVSDTQLLVTTSANQQALLLLDIATDTVIRRQPTPALAYGLTVSPTGAEIALINIKGIELWRAEN